MTRRSASFLALLGLALGPACGNSDSSSTSSATDAAADAPTEVPKGRDGGPPRKVPPAKPDAAKPVPSKDAGHAQDASGRLPTDAAIVLDASTPDAGHPVVAADARTNVPEAGKTCDDAELLRTFPKYVEGLDFGPSCLARTPIVNVQNCPATESDLTSCTSGTCAGNPGCTATLSWHDATVVGTTLTVLLDISGSMPFSYETDDIGCNDAPLSCVLEASIVNAKYTLTLASPDAAPAHFTVTNLKVDIPQLTSSGCSGGTQMFSGLIPYVQGTFASLANYLGTQLRDSVETHRCP